MQFKEKTKMPLNKRIFVRDHLRGLSLFLKLIGKKESIQDFKHMQEIIIKILL